MRSLSAALLLALCSFALGGALTFAWMRKTQGDSVIQAQLDDATIKLVQAESKITQLTTEKQELELALRSQADCGEFQAGPADGWSAYIDEIRGIAVQLPFNETWGYESEPIASAFLPLPDIDGIQFGPPFEIAPCAFAHSIQLTFVPARGSGSIRTEVLERNAALVAAGEVTVTELEPEKMFVGDANLVAYKYSVPSECAASHVEIFGPEFNYIFSACPEGEASLPAVLDSIELL